MKNEFDFIVIGNNWVSSLMASRLSEKASCLKVETNEKLGNEVSAGFAVEQYMPFSDMEAHFLDFMGLSAEAETVQSLTVNSGSLVPFVGFGSKKFPADDYIKSWSATQWLKLNKNFNSWEPEYVSNFKGETLAGYAIDAITPGDDHTIVKVNGKEYKAKKVFYCDDMGELVKVLPKNFVPQKALSKIGKQDHWSMACYEFEHEEAQSETSQPHILWSEKDGSNPCIGQFNKSSEFKTSSWWCLFARELVDDVEETTRVLKFMKKQIKRAYPEFFNTVKKERVTIKSDFMSISEGGATELKEAWNPSSLSVLVVGANELIPPLGSAEAAYKQIEAYL